MSFGFTFVSVYVLPLWAMVIRSLYSIPDSPKSGDRKVRNALADTGCEHMDGCGL